MMLPIALFFLPKAMPTPSAWGAAAVLGVLCTGIAYVLFFRLFARVGPTKAITVAFLIPMFGVLWGWLILNEPVTTLMLAGAVLVIAGLALTTGIIKLPTPAAPLA
jgi:drug/metabolite transporter (DMT)-like permease